MDIATIMGIFVFLGLVISSIFIAEGMAGFRPFANLEALLVVMGGTFCATLVNYPLRQVVGLGGARPRKHGTPKGKSEFAKQGGFIDFSIIIILE